MVCPNCHSDRIIAVQDQRFCINCGQQLPETAITPEPGKSKISSVAVGENGLPEGVKILPITSATNASPTAGDPAPAIVKANISKARPSTKKPKLELPAEPIIRQRSRIPAESETNAAGEAQNSTAPATSLPKIMSAGKGKKRKPGRPKAGRLDVPRAVLNVVTASAKPTVVSASSAPATIIPAAPMGNSLPAAEPASVTSTPGSKRLSDLSPRQTTRQHHAPQAQTAGTEPPAVKPVRKPFKFTLGFTKPKTKSKHHSQHHVHKVGLPPLHYGSVLTFSLRARARSHWLLLGLLAAATLGAAVGYIAWLYLSGGLPRLANILAHITTPLIIEVLILAALYYIGRSVGQAAIIFGVVREADGRPAPLSRQLAVGINTFSRRLTLDLIVGLLELGLIALIVALLFMGGGSWSIHPQLQFATLFIAFLLMLYLLTGLALSRGLAGVALTITTYTPMQAAKLGWQLFSHRFELLALRFLAAGLELLLAVPLAALAIVLIVSVPFEFHIFTALAIGGLAWLAGALFGAGTAAWWAALYRRLVLADRPSDASKLLTGYAAAPAEPVALTVIVALSSFLISAALAVPWLRF